MTDPRKLTITVEDVLKAGPCDLWPEERVRKAMAGRKRWTAEQVMAMPIHASARLWIIDNGALFEEKFMPHRVDSWKYIDDQNRSVVGTTYGARWKGNSPRAKAVMTRILDTLAVPELLGGDGILWREGGE